MPALGHAISGATGAAVSNLATYPLDLIITRLQIQRRLRKDQSKPSDAEYKGLLDAAQKIYDNEGGLAGFYTGLLQDTGKTIADSFFFFLTYNFLRSRRIAARGSESRHGLPAMEELAVGFLAGSFTKLLTTPLANIVTRKQVSALTKVQDESSNNGPHEEPSTSKIFHDILNEKGPLGFWSGYSASLILTLNPSLTFFLFETFKRLLPQSRRDNPPPIATFLMAAFSKSCASAVTYPFSLAKSRAQAGGKQSSRQILKSDIKSASGGVLSGRKTERAAARTTIFGMLLQIAREEGPQGLYEGLHLELAKGFFSHGTTMFVKQAIHRMMIQLYYILRIVLSKFRRRAKVEQLLQRSREQGFEYYDLARTRAIERVVETQGQIKRASEVVGEGAKAMFDRANETAELVGDYVEEEADEWRDLYGTGLAKWFDEK